MSNLGGYVIVVVSLSLAVVAQAHIAVYDEYWTQRQAEALRRTLEAYEPDPLNVTNHFNYHAAFLVHDLSGRDFSFRIARETKDLVGIESAKKPVHRALQEVIVIFNEKESVGWCWPKQIQSQPIGTVKTIGIDRAMETTEIANGTRRDLHQLGKGIKKPRRARGGRYQSLNAIDKCWRGNKNWDKNRKKLADCVLGFGRKTTGGKNGPIYVVSDPSDNDLLNPRPGTLRHAVTRDRPLWIIFARSMNIKLQQELMITNDKTIDGRGASVHISGGAGLTLQFVKNVIIHNIHIKRIKQGNGGMIRDCEHHFGFRTKSDGDGINIFGATNVWIDHVSMTKCSDGMIDAIRGSTAITISNCHLTDHDEVMLFGATDHDVIDKKMQITVAFNHFGKRLKQRMPRARYGLVHVVNNDYTHWEMYAIGGNMNPTIISQGNRFIAPPMEDCKQVTKREYTTYTTWKSWNWQSEKDYFLNGAYFVQSGKANAMSAAPKNPIPGDVAIRPQPGTKVRRLTKDAGTLGCMPGKSC